MLRLPDKLATVVRERLQAQEMGDMHYEATGEFNGKGYRFHLGGDVYPATLGDLPCVVETHKSFDKHTYFKTGEVGQVSLPCGRSVRLVLIPAFCVPRS